MSVVLVNRTPRRPGPEMPDGEIQLQEPPPLPEAQSAVSNMIQMVPMALGSLSMVFMFMRGGSSGVMSYLSIGMMALSAVGMLVTSLVRGAGDRKRQLRAERRDYLRYLSQMRKQVRRTITNQQEAQAWRHPVTAELVSLVRTTRLWERRTQHPDFSDVRIGTGPQRLAAKLAPLSTKPVEDLEPLTAHALRRFIHAYGTVTDQPIAIYLRGFSHLLVRTEDIGTARAMVRAMIAQLSVFHAPEELRIAVVTDGEEREHWEWTKWLPHALHPTDTDGAGAVRLLATSVIEMEQLLGEDFSSRPPYEADAVPNREEPFTVVVLDGVGVPSTSRTALTGYRNAIVVDFAGVLEFKHAKYTLRLKIDDHRLSMVTSDRNRKDEDSELGRPDGMSMAEAARLAVLMAPYRIGDSTDSGEPLEADFDLISLLGINDLYEHDVATYWAKRTLQTKLRIPIGLGADGQPIDLDLKESAQGGMGPHGMLIGATGSGKSELLRTLVLALAVTHSSELLNFVLVDFKGGATFLGLDSLPHTSAVITNLADEAHLVDRMRDALHGEMVRRQELLRTAGNYSSLLEYETARLNGAPLVPMPSLFVVVDEFSELLAAHRDFMELFIMIGRLGRSLGVHLLLASQRLDEGRMNALESHLSYRIGLRTFSAMESRGVLGVPDAYHLPPQPGNGFLRSDISTLTRFKAAYVSGTYRLKRRTARQAVVAGQVVRYGTDYVEPRHVEVEVEKETPAIEETRSLLEIASEKLYDAGPPAYQVWLPPLAVSPTLDELLPPLAPHPEHGLTVENPDQRGRLRVPVGVIDRPFQQIRDVMYADLSGAGGHVGVAGAPQSGKSTVLRTLITGLALTHTPEEVQFYCLDFGGGTLTGLRNLPHMGGVTGRHDPERVLRTIAEVNSIITHRERHFAEQGIDSITAFRRLKAAGKLPDEPNGDVFLVIDGWNTVRQEFPDLVAVLALISQRGLNYGVHLMIATSRWGELSASLRDQLQTRFELRLGDPVDSQINMRAAAKVPKLPGRGLTDDQMHFLIALPRMDGSGSTDDLGEGVADLVDAVADHWTGRRAPKVRMLPISLDAAELPAPRGRLQVAIGLEDQEVEPLWHDFESDPHLIVVGDTESGKTNLMKLMATSIMKAYTPAQARIMLVDFRRELFETVPQEYRLGYAVSVDNTREIVNGATNAMKNRVPSADIPPAQLKLRDWWQGPELFVLVDDYDLVSTSSGTHPFAPILDYLAQGAEIGLHLIVARGANGASRGLNDPLLRKIQEVNSPAVLLSCPPSEGLMFGNLKPRQLAPGRGFYITRRRTVQVQTGLLAEDPPTPPAADHDLDGLR